MSPKVLIQPRLTNFAKVSPARPSISMPSFDTNRMSLRNSRAVHAGFVQCKVFVPLSAVVTSVGAPQTGQTDGISKFPICFVTLTTFGMILLALMTEISVPAPPMPSRSHSEMLQSDARGLCVQVAGRDGGDGPRVD